MIANIFANLRSRTNGLLQLPDRLTCVICIVVGMVIVPDARSQLSSGSPRVVKQEFEVASVKPCGRDTIRGTNLGQVHREGISIACQTLMTILQFAYAPELGGAIQVEGGPPWVQTDLYQITAKADGATSLKTIQGPMLQALLEERFKLKVHKEAREVPAYALVLAKAGVMPPAAKAPCFTRSAEHPFPRWEQGQPPTVCGAAGIRDREGIQIRGSTMEEFCTALSKTPLKLDRHRFIDQTGIKGRFDFDLKFPYPEPPGEPSGPAVAQLPSDDLSHLQGSLSKIGLKLVAAKAPAEFVHIDYVERPSSN